MNNIELDKTVRALRRESRKGAAIWSALAEDLDRSKRSRVAVNLSIINRHSTEGDVVAIPGKVLGSGSITHPVTVAAFSFSSTAIEKIKKAEGRAIGLKELIMDGTKPSKVKILK